MKESFRKCVKNKLTPEWKLEIQTLLVMGMSLLTILVMSSYIDQYQKPAEPEESGQTAGTAAPVAAEPEENHEGIIRFHVRANSDSEEDQELKLEVRNQVMAKVQSGLMEQFAREIEEHGEDALDDGKRIEITRSYLQNNLDVIEDWAAETIKAEGAAYPVTAELGITWIPERKYDGIYFPAGNYEALNIIIGDGAGQNWWCVIFPPLCLIDGRDEPEEEQDLYGEIHDDRITAMGGDQIILKSKILELLERK